jgi:hypothetical protein
MPVRESGTLEGCYGEEIKQIKKKELSSLQIHKPKILLQLKKHMSLTSNIDGLILIQLNHQVSGI